MWSRPGQPLVWPGQFVFGYPEQDPMDPLRPRPPTTRGPAWARNGSFVVVRRLRQDVAGFWRCARRHAEALRRKGVSDMTEVRLAALLVGRWPSGAPLARDARRGRLRAGRRCPRQQSLRVRRAHCRRADDRRLPRSVPACRRRLRRTALSGRRPHPQGQPARRRHRAGRIEGHARPPHPASRRPVRRTARRVRTHPARHAGRRGRPTPNGA